MTNKELVGKYLTRGQTGTLCDPTSLFIIIIGRSDGVERGRECKIVVCRTSQVVDGGGGGVKYKSN